MFGKDSETGAAMVEFALILPLLVLLLLGIIQFGFIFNAQITLTSAVREGARHAVVGNTDEDVKQRVIDYSTALLLKLNKIEVKDKEDAKGNKTKEVTAEGTVDLVMPLPFLEKLIENLFPLKAKSIMRNEKTS
ncbi:MAG: pilus assembly protein [Desulfobacterium sp.]|nr:pilus assembly protein [Desulfobacterium sp.]